ncbi:hypothetical protein BLA29_012441, partial [Euroglyphus maynei]
MNDYIKQQIPRAGEISTKLSDYFNFAKSIESRISITKAGGKNRNINPDTDVPLAIDDDVFLESSVQAVDDTDVPGPSGLQKSSAIEDVPLAIDDDMFLESS